MLVTMNTDSQLYTCAVYTGCALTSSPAIQQYAELACRTHKTLQGDGRLTCGSAAKHLSAKNQLVHHQQLTRWTERLEQDGVYAGSSYYEWAGLQ